MTKRYQNLIFKFIILFNFLLINSIVSVSLAQVTYDVDKYAIINSEIESLLGTDNNNLKTVEFSIKGISNNEEAEKLKSKFFDFGGVKECILDKTNDNQDIYNFKMKFYEKAHLNYFLKMLITFDINYTMYKGVLKRTEELRISAKTEKK